MKKILKFLFAICIALSIFAGASLLKEKTIAKAEGYTITLTSGTHEKWIDRIDLSSAQYAKDFYDWLVESTDNDGVDDELIYVTKEEHLIIEFTENFTVEASGSLEDAVYEEGRKRANANFDEVADYCSMVYAAFNRDYNEVFWLQREIRTNSAYELSYKPNGDTILKQNVTMLLKKTSSDPRQEFDVRLDVYVNGILDLGTEISRVNNVIENVLSGIDNDATRYEKVKYFNKYLTENNCYALTIGENSRDCRGALLGQAGNSNYAPVCEGYARAFKVLCDRAEIPCVLSSGMGNTEEHMWNLVQMEDGLWYGVDVTWNDPTVGVEPDKLSGVESEDYLLVGADTNIDGKTFKKSHKEINEIYKDKIPLDNGPMLTANAYKVPTCEGEWDVSRDAGVDNVTATLYKIDGTSNYRLVISGNGNMLTYSYAYYYPWSSYAPGITEIEIRQGVEEILGKAFYECTNLSQIKILGDLHFENGVFAYGQPIYCHNGYECYDIAEASGYNVTSLCEISDWRVVTPQGCEDDEILKGECQICAYEHEQVGALRHGHSYGNWEIAEKPTDVNNGLIERVCAYDSNHIETFEIPALNTFDYSYSVIDHASCEDYGEELFVYYKDSEEIEIYVEVKPYGHEYGSPSYNWSEDYKHCTAIQVCLNDASHTLSEEVESVADREVTCDYDGYVTYTAKFDNSAYETQTNKVYKTAIPHEFSHELQHDKKAHWYECTNCNARKGEVEHTFGKWKTKEKPGIFLTGEKERKCDCGYSEVKTMPRQNFFDAIINGSLTMLDTYVLIGGGSVLLIILIIIFVKIFSRKKRF